MLRINGRQRKGGNAVGGHQRRIGAYAKRAILRTKHRR